MSGAHPPDAAQPTPADGRDRWLAFGLTALAAGLVLPDLGSPMLWQDEAQTALVARTILEHGVPLGFDGTNHFSQELGKEYAAGYVWRWHTWLSFYATAASFALFGTTTFAARLPFALCGALCAGLCFETARVLWRDRAAAVIAGGACALSVPFLLFSRQCRYYTLAALLSLLALRAYASLDAPARWPRWSLFGAAFALFHTHYVYCATLLAGLGLHALLFRRTSLRAVAAVGLGVAVSNAPWIAWFAGVRPGGDAYLASVLDAGKLLRFSVEYLELLAEQFFPLWLLAIPAGLWLWSRRAGDAGTPAPAVVEGVGLIVCFALASVLLLAALSPLLFYRYLAPVAPPLFVLTGLLIGRLWRRSRGLGAAAAAALVLGQPLPAYLGELRSDFVGPVEGLVRFLERHAEPGDVVAISYGDLPLKFYTPYRVVGGLTGEGLEDVARARFLVMRRHTNTAADAEVKRAIRRELRRAPDRFVRHRLDAPDTAFQNREDPRLHRYRSAPAGTPRLVVFERVR